MTELVFRGWLRRLNYGYWNPQLDAFVAQGMEQYLWENKILFKDYLDHVKRVSRLVKQNSIAAFEKLGLPAPFLNNPSADKEAKAREVAADKKVERGLVCALSSSARWNPALPSSTEAPLWSVG